MKPIPTRLIIRYIAQLPDITLRPYISNVLTAMLPAKLRPGGNRLSEHPEAIRGIPAAELRDPLITLLLFFSGCRCQELINLTDGDVYSEGTSVTFHIRTIKGGIERTVLAKNRVLADYLDAYRRFRNPAAFGRPLIRDLSDRRRLTTRHIHRIIRTLFPGYSPHSFRHTFARILLEANIPIRQIQYSLGHRRLTTTELYLAKVQSADLSAAWSIVDKIMSEFQQIRTSTATTYESQIIKISELRQAKAAQDEQKGSMT